MARVYLKDGTIMEGRRCVLKRAILRKLKYDGRVPYRFSCGYQLEEQQAYWRSPAGHMHSEFARLVRYGVLDQEGNEL